MKTPKLRLSKTPERQAGCWGRQPALPEQCLQLRSSLATAPRRRNVKNPCFSAAAATTTVSLVFCRKQLPAALLPPAESWRRGAALFGLSGLQKMLTVGLGRKVPQHCPSWAWWAVGGCRKTLCLQLSQPLPSVHKPTEVEHPSSSPSNQVTVSPAHYCIRFHPEEFCK